MDNKDQNFSSLTGLLLILITNFIFYVVATLAVVTTLKLLGVL